MTKKTRRVQRKSSGLKGKFILLIVVAIAITAAVFYVKNTLPISGRHTFTFTQVVGQAGSDECVRLTYRETDYCIDEWSNVYTVMDETNRATSRTVGATVKVEFDADFHTGTKMFVGTTEVPTIFLDKVYSATATKQ